MKAASLALSLCLLISPASEAQVIRGELKRAPQKPDLVTKVDVDQLVRNDRMKLDEMVTRNLVITNASKFAAQKRQMDLIVEDIKRVTGLPPDKSKLLHLAALGAVDRSLDNWRTAQESRVREVLQGATTENVEERIRSVGEVHVGGAAASDNSIWLASLTRLLSPEEQAKWRQAQQERINFRAEALAGLLTAEMERRLTLTPEQVTKLEPLFAIAFNSYLPDMGNYLDRNSGVDFRLLALVVNGVPEVLRTAILTEAQIQTLQGITADFSGWWQSIEQNHQRRLAAESPPQAK